MSDQSQISNAVQQNIQLMQANRNLQAQVTEKDADLEAMRARGIALRMKVEEQHLEIQALREQIAAMAQEASVDEAA